MTDDRQQQQKKEEEESKQAVRCAEIAKKILKKERPRRLLESIERALNLKVAVVACDATGRSVENGARAQVSGGPPPPGLEASALARLPVICRACTGTGV